MRPIATDGLEWSVGLSVTIMSPAKAAEAIEMPFGMWTRVGRRNYVREIRVIWTSCNMDPSITAYQLLARYTTVFCDDVMLVS